LTPPLPTRVGRYEIIDRLGQGGMGVVYLATDPLLRRTVAIKVLPGGDDEIRERFGREARSAASLRHNNVVTIYDVGENDDQPFIAMEFLDGESMHELIQRKASVPVDRRLMWMVELCAGLSHAHRSGVIHRDIKPGNLMITTEGSLKILDFGLARLTSGANQTGLTRAGAIMGTPHYMSPEQVTGETVDARSDIFSVGLVLYELLSYAKAFAGDSAPVVLHNILHKTPPPIRSLLPQIDDELETVVERAIEKDREKRYQDLATFGADLARIRTRIMRNSDEVTQRRPAPQNAGNLDPTFIRPSKNVNIDALAQRRASQIASYIHAAMKQFDVGNYDAAIAECENALMLNPQEGSAIELIDRAHRAAEDANVNRWLEEARALISGGALTAAEALIDQSLKVRADSTGAQALQRELKDKRRDREREAERQRAAQAAITRARGHINEGAFEAAIRCASEALGHDPSNADARALKEQATAAIAKRRATTQPLDRNSVTAAIGNAPPLSLGAETMPVPPVVNRKEPPKPITPVRRGLPVPLLAAIAAVVVLVVGGGWYFLGQPEPPAEAVTGPSEIDEAARALSTAQEQYRNRDERGALATLARIPAGNRDAERLADTIRGAAAARTDSARNAADAAQKSGVDAYQRAVQKQNEARALGSAVATADRVVALFDESTTLFGAALRSEVAGTNGPKPPPIDVEPVRLTEEQRQEIARLVEEGQRQLDEGEYDAAITAYQGALRIDPANAQARAGVTGVRRAQAAEAAALAGLKKKPGA
jgi:serine/threonine protein kinase